MKAVVCKPVSSKKRLGGGDRNTSLTVIFKGLDKCNADCSYCSVGHTDGRVMAPPDFNLLARQLGQLVKAWHIHRLSFTFHGGEPTLLGAEFLETICRKIATLAPEVTFNMQSNLISLPCAVLEVAERYRIRIGTSVDPLGVDRVDRNGRNLFWPWLRNYLALAKRGDAPGAIYVVTNNSLGQAERIYNICEAIGHMAGVRFSLQINHAYAQGKAGEPDRHLIPNPEAFGDFLVDMWRIWEGRGRTLSIGPISVFSDYFRSHQQVDPEGDPEGLLCSFATDCSRSHVGIDLDGNVAGCGRRLDSKAFCGNLKDGPLEEILEHSTEKVEIAQRADTLRQSEPCSGCEFFILCHGGCPDDAALGQEGLTGRFPLCEGYRKFFVAMKSEIRNLPEPAQHVRLRPQRQQTPPRLIATGRVAALPRRADRRSSVWMLPDAEGRWLAFDAGLDRALHRITPRTVRLWVHNRQVPFLMLWEDLVRRSGVEIGLFESDDLDRALNLLNAMGASIVLDPIAIGCAGEGADRLALAVHRFTGDPQWQSQVAPFMAMVRRVVENRGTVLTDQFGLEPQSHELVCEDGASLGEEAAQWVNRLSATVNADAASWLEQRKACLACRYLRPCGGAMWSNMDRGCFPDSFRLVEQIVMMANEMRRLLPRVGQR